METNEILKKIENLSTRGWGETEIRNYLCLEFFIPPDKWDKLKALAISKGIRIRRTGLFGMESSSIDRRKRYYQLHREELRQRSRQYYLAHRKEIIERVMKWKAQNKEKVRQYDREYRLKNKQKIKERMKRYYEQKKEEIKAYYREYYKKNREKILQLRREYYRRKKEEKLLKGGEEYV